jgi:hypothetical protein
MNLPPLPEPRIFQAVLSTGSIVNVEAFSRDDLMQLQRATLEACAKVCEEYETVNDITATWQNIISDKIRSMKHE